MITSLLRVIAALFALTFIVAACASDSGAQWTFAPSVAQSDTNNTAAPAEEGVTPEATAEAESGPAAEGPTEPAEPAEVEQPVAASGEPRTIQLQATGALQFTDAEGQKVADIAVTPGETIVFEVDNTAGFAHNMYIGEDAQLSVPSGTTDSGMPDWNTGVATFEWVVPDDISNLKFGCTVPGHYGAGMQGTFSLDETASTTPVQAEGVAPETATEPAAEATEPVEPTTASGEPRTIQLQATGALQFTDAEGQKVADIAVTPGEMIVFEIDNTAGFAHNFYIGEDAQLSTPSGTTDVGIPDWNTGVETLEWVVPDDISNLKFGCTVPGHYTLMQGTFSVDDAATTESAEPAEPAEAVTELTEPAETATEPAAEATEPVEPTTASGEPRTIQLQATGALQFTDAEGQKVADIAVTPGEMIVFEIDNTAGFAHNFYIGEDAQLSTPSGTTDVGIPDWNTGVETLEWVVPDDISNLKFGCTVPGHYTLMQGTFSVDDAATTESAEPAEPAEAVTELTEPAETATEPAAEATEPVEPTTASGEPRTIQLQATGALQFTDAEGQKVADIAVTPGETIVFEVDNTAGFAHNMYIGEDAQLSVPSGTTDFGMPDWNTGVATFEWVVPDDISNLKFGCTVPGHYGAGMQGTFSVDDAATTESAEPAEPAEAVTELTEPAETATEPAAEVTEPVEGAAVDTDARVITLEADAALRFLQDGEQIRDIPVTPGEKIVFRVDNTAGFAHNFYIGEDAQLSAPAATTDVGIPDWDTGVQHLDWIVPDDITNLKFGCTVPGHYTLMQGTFSISE